MTSRWTTWISIFALYLQNVDGCVGSDVTSCATAWYFWFCIFVGFLVLFIIIFCIVNKCNKKNKTTGLETPRVISAVNRQKRQIANRPISNTSFEDVSSHPANTVVVNQAWSANQTTVNVTHAGEGGSNTVVVMS